MDDLGIFTWDLEVSPMLAWVYDMYDARVLRVEKHWYIQSFSIKRLDSNKIITKALPDYPGYKPGTFNDHALVRDLHKHLIEANILVGHNSDKFDTRKLNLRFAALGLDPIPTWKTIDTYKVAKKYLNAPSYSLDFLCQYYELGAKNGHHSDLWYDCHVGDMKAWSKMKRYNANDVKMTERLYLKLRPFMNTHPNLNLLSGEIACPKCQSISYQKRGSEITMSGRISVKLKCIDCGGWWRLKTEDTVPGIIARN